MDEQWMATEQALLNHADSLGELFEQLRPQFSPVLIDGEGWENLVERARGLPVTMAAFPFGFELSLHDREPRADLGISLVSGSRTAATFEDWGRIRESDRTLAGLVELLGRKGREETPLCRVTGPKMMLEYDVGPAVAGAKPNPGLFLYPIDLVLAGGAKDGLVNLRVVLDALVSAAAWEPVASEHHHAERIYENMTADTRVLSVGVFPSRARAIRFAVTGFESAGALAAFLERSSWPGHIPTVSALVSRLEKRDAFTRVAAHLDVRGDGLGTRLCLSFFGQPDITLQAIKGGGYWLDRPGYWTAILEEIGESGLARPEKLDELSRWSSGSRMLYGSGGVLLLVRGIHHVKLVIEGNRISQVKAYAFMMMCAT